MFPPDAMGATQNINAVPSGPPGRGSDRPLYRDEVPEDAGADTAQFDAQAMDDYDDYEDYDDHEGYGDYDDRAAKKRKILMVSAFTVLLLIAGGSAFLFASGVPSGGADAATVANEDADPGALEPDTLFPETLEFEGHEGEFTRVATEDSEDCAAGAHGDYGQVLADNDCRQLVRASYVSEDENHAVTIGVAAMPTEAEAETARESQDLVASEWFAGLPGEEGTPAERLGYSGGHGISGHWGRYVLFSLATNSDGTEESEEGSEGDSEGATELRSIGEGLFDELYEKLSEERS